MAIASINPASGEFLRTFAALSGAQIEEKLTAAASCFRSYRRTSFQQRAAWLKESARILDEDKEHWARIMTLEMGKPIQAARDEAAKCATACRFYAEHAESFLQEEVVQAGARRSAVRYQPIGPVLAIMPWNFPFWQVFRFAAPALMAGNVGLLKHAANVPQCALAIEEILSRAGFPTGAFQTLLIESSAVAPLIEDDRVAAVTLTGSVGAGASVASVAGKQIKKTVLELGGSDPFIVMPSADLELAAATAVKARTINNGQSCIAAKRFLVHEQVADEFEKRFVAGMRALKVGDPMDESVAIGPLATESVLLDVQKQVNESRARILTGGKRLPLTGYFFEPTVLTDIPTDSPVYREEVFGPVAMLFRVRNMDEAIRIANDTEFGLGASVWTRDEAEHDRFADEIESGQVFFNAMVASDPRVPFGGIKKSGYGRELGAFGIREFTNIKTIWDGA